MNTNTSSKNPIQSLEKAFTILRGLKQLDGARVTELANYFELPKSTVYRYLTTLEQGQFVVNDGGIYRLSLQFLEYGTYVRGEYPRSQLFKETTSELANKTGERTQFFVEEYGRGVHLYKESGEHGISADVEAGKTVPLHATSGGKAILAFLPEDTIEDILDRYGLPEYTENTITDRDELLSELSEIRTTKIAYNREERVNGFYSVGCPVIHNDFVIGAFSVTGSKRRMQGQRAEEKLPNTLLELSEEIELKLKYDQ